MIGTSLDEPTVCFFERSDGKRFRFDNISKVLVNLDDEINIEENDVMSVMEGE
jgi:hypothetical protein